MNEELSFVSVIIPCRNEENFIGKCLDSVLSQDYPKDKLEVLVVDGKSEDKTKEVIDRYAEKHTFVRALDNPDKFAPFALNVGIKNSKGDVIVRMDAHADYNNDYISKCVKHLNESGADNVGGVMQTVAVKDNIVSKAIAMILSRSFGSSSSFRIGSAKPKEVDTVFGGCYRKSIFDKIGLFNEKLLRSEDMELNIRLKKRGGKILLFPDIVSRYYPKAKLKDFFFHNIKDGIWSTYPLKLGRISLRPRHYVPLILVLFLLLSLVLGLLVDRTYLAFIVLYVLVILFLSLFLSLKNKDLRYFFVLPLAFLSRHIGYGLGSIIGLIKIII